MLNFEGLKSRVKYEDKINLPDSGKSKPAFLGLTTIGKSS